MASLAMDALKSGLVPANAALTACAVVSNVSIEVSEIPAMSDEVTIRVCTRCVDLWSKPVATLDWTMKYVPAVLTEKE